MSPLKFNLRITVALLLLLLATVGAAYLDLGAFNTPLAMLISLAKASLIVTFFMNLRTAPGLQRLAFGAGLFWLSILFALSLCDFLMRRP